VFAGQGAVSTVQLLGGLLLLRCLFESLLLELDCFGAGVGVEVHHVLGAEISESLGEKFFGQLLAVLCELVLRLDGEEDVLEEGDDAVVAHGVDAELFVLEHEGDGSRVDHHHDPSDLVDDEMTHAVFEFLGPAVELVDGFAVGGVDVGGLVLALLAVVEEGGGEDEEH
jgi:hypothetical protein